jgi:hypothetical protein
MKIDIEENETSKWIFNTDELDESMKTHIENCVAELLKPVKDAFRRAIKNDELIINSIEIK